MKQAIKRIIKRTPVLGGIAKYGYEKLVVQRRKPEPFPGSGAYWEKRYSGGGNSGVGSYGFFAEFKADVLNEFVARHHVQKVIELGCGDGNQLRLAKYPKYVGYDVSSTAIATCKKAFASDRAKSFRLMSEYDGEKGDLALSLDVIYHLIEDAVFERYMRTLFGASSRWVIIYSSDYDGEDSAGATHVRHRKFTDWVRDHITDWKLVEHRPNRYPYQGDHRTGSFADFFIYEKVSAASA